MIRPEIPAESTRGSVSDRRPDLHDLQQAHVGLWLHGWSWSA